MKRKSKVLCTACAAAEALFCRGLEASIPRPSDLSQSIQGIVKSWITELSLLLRVGSGLWVHPKPMGTVFHGIMEEFEL